MPRTTETRSVRDRNVFHEANAKSRQAGRLKAKSDAKEALRQQQHEERMESLRVARERMHVKITAPDEEVWHYLSTQDGEFVAELLGVTAMTLTTWMEEPSRAEALARMWRSRGKMGALAVKGIGQDYTADPQHRAMNLKARTWEAKEMDKETFGDKPQPEAPVGAPLPAELYLSTAIALATQAGLLGQIAALMPPAGSVVATQPARPPVRLPAAVEDDGGTWDEP